MKAPRLNDLDASFPSSGGRRHPRTRCPGTFTSLEQCFPNRVPWNTRAEGQHETLCRKQGSVRSYFRNLLGKSKLNRNLCCGSPQSLSPASPARPPTLPGHLSPFPASSQPPPPDPRALVIPLSGHITALPVSSRGPQTHGGRRPGDSRVLHRPGCIPFLLTSPPAPFQGPGTAQGSAPGACLGWALQGRLLLLPVLIQGPPPTQTLSHGIPDCGLTRCPGTRGHLTVPTFLFCVCVSFSRSPTFPPLLLYRPPSPNTISLRAGTFA